MARSIWKGPYIDKTIWKRLKTIANLSNKTQEGLGGAVSSKTATKSTLIKPWGKIYNRRSMITPELMGVGGTGQSAYPKETTAIKCEVHTGNKWINLNINEDRIGHLFGEFAPTKKIAQFKRKAKAKKKNK